MSLKSRRSEGQPLSKAVWRRKRFMQEHLPLEENNAQTQTLPLAAHTNIVKFNPSVQRGRQTPLDTALLIATVQTEATKYRKSRHTTRVVGIVFSVLIVFMIFGFVYHGLRTGKWDASEWLTNVSLFGCFGGFAASKTHKAAASQLAQIEDIRAIGPLAESLDIDDKAVRSVVADALIRLLPRLQASDAGLLSREQRDSLNRALPGKNDALICAILKAYEQVGDENALPFVTKLAETTANKPRSPQVVEAAQVCLPLLRVRVDLQRASQTLLRGASAKDAQPDTLLRPATDCTPMPQELLRAANE